MTKQTNYVATVTDANSVFPPKGEAVPNSNRGLITSASGQTQGSVGAKDSWYIDTRAEPIASYPNNRLPRWQDLIPLACDFTYNVSQVPIISQTPVLDSTTGLNLLFDSSGSMAQVYPVLITMASTILKPCLLPYYNNDSTLYDQRVQVIPIGDERTIQWLSRSIPYGATKVVNMTFANEVEQIYQFGPGWTVTSPLTIAYIEDINYTNARLNADMRSISYRVTDTVATLYKEFLNAVYTGQGNYSGVMGLSTNPYSTLIDDVDENEGPVYFANKVIEGLKLLGYNVSYC
jgi:hypothetical protein